MLARMAFLLAGLTLPALICQTAHAASAEAEAILDSGQASWYGAHNAGLRTFSGERFDPSRMTAAHTTLAIGTIVRVTDVTTGRSVIVRVNDRLPPHGVRCIDLSEGAATALGIRSRGLADVTLSAVAPRTNQGMVEVAEAPDDALADAPVRRVSARHGRRHRHHAGR